MENKYYNNISSLTNIPKEILQKISALDLVYISHEIALSDKPEVIVPIGEVGQLLVKWDDNQIICRLIPSDSLINIVKDTVNTGKSQLEKKLEEKLTEKVLKTYKDIL